MINTTYIARRVVAAPWLAQPGLPKDVPLSTKIYWILRIAFKRAKALADKSIVGVWIWNITCLGLLERAEKTRVGNAFPLLAQAPRGGQE